MEWVWGVGGAALGSFVTFLIMGIKKNEVIQKALYDAERVRRSLRY